VNDAEPEQFFRQSLKPICADFSDFDFAPTLLIFATLS